MRKRFRIGYGIRIEDAQWRALELLEPGWIFMIRSAIHCRCRQGLERRGWAEFRIYDEYAMGRLTPAGMEVRDRVYARRARKRNRELHGR